jgi:hypothetical protein
MSDEHPSRAGREEPREMSHDELLREMRYFGVAPEDDEEQG